MIKYQNYRAIAAISCHGIRAYGNSYSTSAENLKSPLKTVELAYASYETAPSEKKDTPPLVILHGLFGSKSNWTSMSKAIHKSTGRKVIAVDARNHGDSPHSEEHSYPHMAADVAALLQRLAVPRASLMGHSMGGRTAMLLALLQPELISSLIIADISPFKTSPQMYTMDSLFDAMEHVSVPSGIPLSQARKVADAQLSVAISNLAVRSFIITNLVQSDSNSYIWRVNLPVLKEAFKSQIAVFEQNLTDLKFNGKTSFLGGTLSDYIAPDELPQLRTLFPKAELTFIEGTGHWLHSEKPEKFLKLVCDHLTKD